MSLLLLLLGCPVPVAETDEPQLVGDDRPDLPVQGLSDAWSERFVEGDALFDKRYLDTQGLGPVFIRNACSACHASDGRGPGVVEKMVLVEDDGVTPKSDQSGLEWGHTVRPFVGGGAITPLEPPDRDDLLITLRGAPPVMGRGYLEAVTDDAIEQAAAEQVNSPFGVSGRVPYVTYASVTNPDDRFHDVQTGDTLIGRFGLKARIGTSDDFAADAFQGDMSMTSPLRPTELPNPDGLTDDAFPGPDLSLDTINLVGDYVRLIGIPRRTEDAEGRAVFADVGCAACHMPAMPTRADYPIEPLAGIDAPIYSDLLLHDMGIALSDGLAEGDAAPQEWKTPPLMGMRFQPYFLHDGRASTVSEAIAAHAAPDSESATSYQAYSQLSPDDQAALIRFVEGL